MGRVEGKVALVTGAARGMGAAFARRLVAEGARVMITDVLEAQGRAVAAELGDNARFERHDITRTEDWARVVAATEKAFGPITILVNNAGVFFTGGIDTTPEADFRRVVDINQLGVFLGLQSTVPSMRTAGGGSIINMSSIGGIVGGASNIAYVTSKFAVRGMTKAAAIELAPHGIRVNSIHPGLIETAMTSDENGLIAEIKAAVPFVPLQRIGKPEDVASMMLYLASDESAYSTGAEFIVDGGFIAQ